jgi:hypothetical protein
MTLGLHTVLGGEIELPAAAGPWRVLLSSHDTARPEVGSRVAVGPLEAIILELEPTTIDG